MTYAQITGMRSARHPLQGCGCVGDCGCAGLGCGCAPMAGLGGKFDAVTATTFPEISGLPMPLRVIDIRVRAGSTHALAVAMGAEIARNVRANTAFNLDPYASTLDTIRALVRSATHSLPPVQIVQNLVVYGVGQMDRLATAALAATDAVLSDKTNPNSVVVNDANVARLRLALQAVERAEQIQATILRIFNAMQSQQGTSGLGGSLERSAAIMGAGLFFGIFTGGASIPIAMLVTLVDLLSGADSIVTAIQATIGKAVESLTKAVETVVEGAAGGAGEAAGVLVKYALIGGSVLLLGFVAYNYVQYRVFKSPTGRRIAARAVGGPVGAALAPNRRRRRTSHKVR